MPTLLITGVGGYIGQALAARALRAGWLVRGTARRPEAARRALPAAVEVLGSDIRDSNALRRAFEGADAVAHLAAISYERGQETFEAVHVGGTQAVLDAMALAGVGRLLYMSALGTRPAAPSRFHQSRWSAEQAVRGSGLDWTIMRPSLVFGPGDYFVSLHLRLLRRLPALPIIGDGRQLLQPIALDDLALACVRACERPITYGQTYDAVGPLRLRLAALLDLIMELVGVRRPKLHLPLVLAHIGAPLLERQGNPPPLTRDQLLLLQEDNIGDPGPLSRDLDLQLAPPRAALAYLRELDLRQARGARIG
jgi:NADH dehydrogenase